MLSMPRTVQRFSVLPSLLACLSIQSYGQEAPTHKIGVGNSSAPNVCGPNTTPSSICDGARPSEHDSAYPRSLFDSVNPAVDPVTTWVEVRAIPQESGTRTTSQFLAGGEDVIKSAGTHGDLLRFLQLFPGVIPSSDLSNQMLVRGGHPMENLFLVDGIEVPNINHLANANTSGGFGPMIDAAVIQSLELHTGGFEAKYPERLSSVTEFHTLEPQSDQFHAEADFGIQAVGGLLELPVGGGDLLTSGHHGLLDIATSDAGINGVPSYTNELTRFRQRRSSDIASPTQSPRLS